jgi:cyclopropane fatty-acyl-phospholipid synthase-like methyltransferase
MVFHLPPLHDEMTFLSPLSEDRAAGLVRWLSGGLGEGETVLDIGCGWGELVLRVAEAAPSAYAVGVDIDEPALEEARRRAAARGLEGRATFLTGDGAEVGPETADAIVAIGVTQVWGAAVEDNQPLAYAEALSALRGRVRRGGRVLYADGVWSRTPTPEAAAPLSGRLDEFVTLPELATIATESGFALAGVAEASLDEWDEFESSFNARNATWLAHHDAEHADAAQVRERAARQQAAYLQGYRGVLGMAYLRLLAV